MKRIYIFCFFISTCLGAVFNTYAQQNTQKTSSFEETTPFRIGIDAFSFSRNFWDKNYNSIDLTADYLYKKNHYATVEAGFVDKYTSEDRINFSTKGSYLRIGIDKNLHNNWKGMHNMIFVGGRYGISFFNQNLISYNLTTIGGIFEEEKVIVNRNYNGLQAHWAELVLGTKVEIIPRLFLGFNFRTHLLLYNSKLDQFENLYIPGFGKKYSGSIGASFNYTISYSLPIKKKIQF